MVFLKLLDLLKISDSLKLDWNNTQYSKLDEFDDLEAKRCPTCNGLMIKQEIDLSWFCQKCDRPHGEERATVEEINYRKCANCGKDSGIFDLCVDCRPKD